MQENAATCTVASERGTRTASIIDVPGHASMRAKLEALLQEAAGIVFLVDAVDVTPQRTEAADLLYEVLTHPVVVRQRLPLLIACNKADMEMEAHSKVGVCGVAGRAWGVCSGGWISQGWEAGTGGVGDVWGGWKRGGQCACGGAARGLCASSSLAACRWHTCTLPSRRPPGGGATPAAGRLMLSNPNHCASSPSTPCSPSHTAPHAPSK